MRVYQDHLQIKGRQETECKTSSGLITPVGRQKHLSPRPKSLTRIFDFCYHTYTEIQDHF